MKKIPLRKCIATQEQLPKKELLRIVRTPDGTVVIDATGKMNGRGAYLKKNREAVEIALKRKALERALEVTLDASFIAKLRALFNES